MTDTTGKAPEETNLFLTTLEDIPPYEWPEDARDTLLSILQDKHASQNDRVLAASLAGDYTVIDDGVAEILLEVMENNAEPEELRGQSAISFGAAFETADSGDLDGFEDSPISKRIFDKIRKAMRDHYLDAATPKYVRRRILEASVRAPEKWHPDTIRAAYASDDEEWRLTAVFAMRFIRGFDTEILESLEDENPDILFEAVCAAGSNEVQAAWPHLVKLLQSKKTDKDLLLAAIDSAATVNPEEAEGFLSEFMQSEDEDIAEVAHGAFLLSQPPPDGEVWF